MSPQQFTSEHHQIRQVGELLESLESYGWNGIEDILFCGICRGRGSNIALLGNAGSNKTRGGKRILKALYGTEGVRVVNTQVEDALSLGVCDVPDLAAQKMSTFKTDNSIIRYPGLVLDELNRADASTNSLYLSILEERAVLGHPVEAKIVMITSNPLDSDYHGVQPLDKALAERISLLIRVPDYHMLDKRHRHAILDIQAERESKDSMPSQEACLAIQAAVAKTRLEFPRVADLLKKEAIQYTDEVLIQAERSKINLESGRTGQHVVRNFLWLRAFRHAVYGEDITEGLDESAQKVLKNSLISELYTDPVPIEKLNGLHAFGAPYLMQGEGHLIAQYNKIPYALESLAFLLGNACKAMTETEKIKLLINARSRLAGYESRLGRELNLVHTVRIKAGVGLETEVDYDPVAQIDATLSAWYIIQEYQTQTIPDDLISWALAQERDQDFKTQSPVDGLIRRFIQHKLVNETHEVDPLDTSGKVICPSWYSGAVDHVGVEAADQVTFVTMDGFRKDPLYTTLIAARHAITPGAENISKVAGAAWKSNISSLEELPFESYCPPQYIEEIIEIVRSRVSSWERYFRGVDLPEVS